MERIEIRKEIEKELNELNRSIAFKYQTSLGDTILLMRDVLDKIVERKLPMQKLSDIILKGLGILIIILLLLRLFGVI